MITRKPALLLAIVFLLFATGVPYAPAADEVDSDTIVRGKGHGFTRFTGSGILHIGGDGILTLALPPESDQQSPPGDEGIDIIFSPYDTELFNDTFVEPACIDTGTGSCIYIMSEARVWIDGNDLDVTFAGANIGFTASGDARLFLQGYGIFRAESRLGRWTPEGTEISIETD